ncbi:unnamed protein product [Dicrocoelium dendriticum]|nr:unnamed protein product [Dicrocoelium dendriticum]
MSSPEAMENLYCYWLTGDRERQLAVIQKPWMTKRKDAAQAILDGSWLSAHRSLVGLDQTMIEYWRSVFGVQGAVDERPVPKEEGQDYGLIQPLSAADVDDALQNAGDTTPGPDKLSVAYCKSLELTVLAQLFKPMRFSDALLRLL